MAELAGDTSVAIAAYRRALLLLHDQAARFAEVPHVDKGGSDTARTPPPLWDGAVEVVTRNLVRALAMQNEVEEAVQMSEGLDRVSRLPGELCRGFPYVRRFR